MIRIMVEFVVISTFVFTLQFWLYVASTHIVP